MTPDKKMAELAARLRYEACAIRATGQHIKDADDLDAIADRMAGVAQRARSTDRRTPIDMILNCPACGLQHIDAPDERTPDWKNEPHRSHLCHGCGHIWRPADVPTNGVAAIGTRGKADSPIAPRPIAIESLAQRVPLSEADITSACYSFRHDFGLLSPDEQKVLMNEAREWARCFGIRSRAMSDHIEGALEMVAAPTPPVVLPPLPKPFMNLFSELTPVMRDAWADQMHTYARAALAQYGIKEQSDE